jgi:cytochrome P450 family 6
MELSTVLASIGVIYLLNKKYLFSYWSRKGVKQLQPRFLFGDAIKLLTLRQSIADYFGDVYNKYKEHKLVGIYITYKPTLVVNDPELIQNIMIKDFSNFPDRPMPVDEQIDPLSGETKFSYTSSNPNHKGCFQAISSVWAVKSGGI